MNSCLDFILVGGIASSTSTGISKKVKCQATDDGRDLISKLPQSVVCHILSRLPSRDAVRTSILSKDWVYKWTSVYNIDIDDCICPWTSKETRKRANFINFVDKILRPLHDLKTFRLLCQSRYSSTILAAWISTALRRNTESFEIKFPRGLLVPRSFINYTSLRNLTLMPRCSLWIPTCTFIVTNGICFPNLTCLYLKDVEILNERTESDCGRLVLQLPVLQTLELLSCKWSNVNIVEIHSPALDTFKCETCIPDYANRIQDYANPCLIQIYRALLVEFVSSGGVPDNIILIDSVVRNATLINKRKSNTEGCIQVRKLLRGFSGIWKLHLSACMSEAIAQSRQELPLSLYDQLLRLIISVDDAKTLFELLHSAPSLTILEIELDESFTEIDYDAVYNVPLCILLRLEEVTIRHKCQTYKKTIRLAKFLLENGAELKKLYLYNGSSHHSNAEIVDQLLAFLRASACTGIAVC